ncbi:hypothetical protein F5Y16DRAFT_378584 [Xylariaceae sp. FL0255]|nr:hypothetical protein F5Y16DRAFT_378584 [Xylariaceae sp. FL0255]
MPIVKSLVQSGQYAVRALTRDPSNERFKTLQSYGLGLVESVTGTFASEDTLRATFRGAWGAFVNIDGFNSGEKTETFWTMRAWELAIEEGVQFFIYGNLDYWYKHSGFNPKIHGGHYDAKGRVGEFFLAQNKDPKVHTLMRTALFTTSPYIDMTLGGATVFRPVVEGDAAVWRMPLKDGSILFTVLEDCGVFAKWMFDHPDEADGLNLGVGFGYVTMQEYARAYTKVTGHPARWEDIDIDQHLVNSFGTLVDKPTGYNADLTDPSTMTLRRNFSAFFEIWRQSTATNHYVEHNYALLDKIYPGRIKSAEQWLRMENEKGIKAGLGDLWSRTKNLGSVLKIEVDGRKGSL